MTTIDRKECKALGIIGLLEYIAASDGDELAGDSYEIIGDDEHGREASGDISVTELMAEASALIQEQLEEIEGLRAERDEYKKSFDDAAHTIGLMAINDTGMKAEALDLAKDVHWFVRMQASADVGMKQCVAKAREFIEKYDEGES